jgi:predicted Zn-dependent peptidase
MNNPYHIFEFPNGIRLVHREVKAAVAHFGVIVNAGSRDELPEEQGMAHFIEHMIFKGTQKRNSFQVINSLENYGADMNAFTTKEETCVYASFLSEYYPKAVEVLSDIIFNSTFPEEELKKERSVIIDEIHSYMDNPSEWIHDEFDTLLFPAHSLGMNILGTPALLRKYKRSDLIGFMERNYATNRMILSSTGQISFKRMVTLVDRYFGQIPARIRVLDRQVPAAYEPVSVDRKFGRHQAHLIIGNRACNYHDSLRVPMALLNNMLGGPSMNSRLNLALREKHGIAYNLESNFQPLSDTGLFSIYLGTDEKMVEKALHLVNKELKSFRDHAIGSGKLNIARQQLKGQLAISMESMQNDMISAGKSLMVYQKIDSWEEICNKIDQVSAAHLLEAANRIFDASQMSSLLFRHH